MSLKPMEIQAQGAGYYHSQDHLKVHLLMVKQLVHGEESYYPPARWLAHAQMVYYNKFVTGFLTPDNPSIGTQFV